MKRKLISLCLLPLLAFGHWALDFDEDFAAASSSPAARTDFGAWMHLDASYAAGFSNIVENGTNFVYQWTDWRTNAVYARQGTYYSYMPFESDAALNGKNVVAFMPFSLYEFAPQLEFSEARSADIYAVFYVAAKTADDYITILGGDATSDFSGNTAPYLYGPWASATVLNGTNTLNGTLTAALDIAFSDWSVVSCRTAGGGASALNLGRDRGYRGGGCQIAEMLIFTNGVSDVVTAEIISYLGTKWGITVTH